MGEGPEIAVTAWKPGLRPSADWDWDWDWDWVTQGSRKGLPSVTQGPSKGRFKEAPLFATKDEKGGGGEEIAKVAGIAKNW
jgi:hypothetical protein